VAMRTSDTLSLVWMAKAIWETNNSDRRWVREFEQRYRVHIVWVDPPMSIATTARYRFGAARPIRPKISHLTDNLIRLRPVALPALTRPGVRTTTVPLMRAQVHWALRRLGIRPYAVVATYLAGALACLDSDVVSALHGTDDYVAGAELMGLSTSWLKALERKAVLQAQVVTANSPVLAERWSALRRSPVTIIPNGCNPATLSETAFPSVISELPRPVVGLTGRLNARIDIAILEAIVRSGYSLFLVGPRDPRWEGRRFNALISRPQVRYVGRVREDEVAAYMAAVDVGITPYVDTPFNRASFPLKTLDYLAVGRPVVSTDLPATRWLLDDLARSSQAARSAQILVVATMPDEFVAAIRSLVGTPTAPAASTISETALQAAVATACRDFAVRHSWSRRVDALAEAIGLRLPD
jgi:teichuronic acid biosynthesis glycosyltransferase TuaH